MFGRYLQVLNLDGDRKRDQLTAELRHFIDCVRTGRTPRVTGEDGRDALELAERVLDALREHQWEGTPERPARPRRPAHARRLAFPANPDRPPRSGIETLRRERLDAQAFQPALRSFTKMPIRVPNPVVVRASRLQTLVQARRSHYDRLKCRFVYLTRNRSRTGGTRPLHGIPEPVRRRPQRDARTTPPRRRRPERSHRAGARRDLHPRPLPARRRAGAGEDAHGQFASRRS